LPLLLLLLRRSLMRFVRIVTRQAGLCKRRHRQCWHAAAKR
jgi:hypothetical protein